MWGVVGGFRVNRASRLRFVHCHTFSVGTGVPDGPCKGIA